MSPKITYDPEVGFSGRNWREAGEAALMQAVRRWHEAELDPGDDVSEEVLKAHAAAHVLAEMMVVTDDEPSAREALERLVAEDVPRHTAIHAIGDLAMRALFSEQTTGKAHDIRPELREMDGFSAAMGGLDWDEEIFDDGDPNQLAGPWLHAVSAAFAWSPEGRAVGPEGWVPPLLESLIEAGMHPADLNPELFDHAVVEVLPMFLQATGDDAPELVTELSAFLSFIERAFEVEWAAEARERIDTPLFRKRLARALDETPGVDALLDVAKKAGLDLDTEEGLEQLEALLAQAIELEDDEPAPVETLRRDSAKVGRNDPCACGSGKKYKNCCG